MSSFILWLAAVEVIGLAAFPICHFLFPRLRDRGYAVSKAFGLLLLGYVSWVLSALHIVPSVRLTIFGLLILMAVVSAWYAWGRRRELAEFFRRERNAILMAEGAFVAVLVAWTLYRAYDPAITHTEQPMDFAFLNASIRKLPRPARGPVAARGVDQLLLLRLLGHGRPQQAHGAALERELQPVVGARAGPRGQR